jgi:hypothetical protein
VRLFFLRDSLGVRGGVGIRVGGGGGGGLGDGDVFLEVGLDFFGGFGVEVSKV